MASTCRNQYNVGFADCDRLDLNGCEVNLLTNTTHCSACGTTYPSRQYCLAGMCRAGTVATVASGNDHVCAIRGTGTVWCWGYNGWGQLGDGSTASRLVLGQVRGISNAVEVAASSGSSFARLSDGTVVGGGLHYGTGELGDGSMAGTRPEPVAVVGLRDIVDIDGGLGTLVRRGC
jgi:alpha-tubulin suppressor-like RCC1 family protein